jgi:hypothetical protein
MLDEQGHHISDGYLLNRFGGGLSGQRLVGKKFVDKGNRSLQGKPTQTSGYQRRPFPSQHKYSARIYEAPEGFLNAILNSPINCRFRIRRFRKRKSRHGQLPSSHYDLSRIRKLQLDNNANWVGKATPLR